MNVNKITLLLAELKDHIQHKSVLNEDVSKASVEWHLSHTIQIFSAICKNATQSAPEEYQYAFNKNRFKIWLIGYIPRGIGRSPKAFLNQEELTEEQLLAFLNRAEELFEDFQKVSKNHFFTHPIFGQLNKKRTLWFLHLHTKHHLKIIRDIIKK
ncbi:MAG: DUF1569 domain-containing protein [Crocinitomicaceae bacterium]